MCVFDQCSLFQHICILFSVNPDKDPLCVLLLIDYFAVRSCEYDFLINLYKSWDVSATNFAFSVPWPCFTVHDTAAGECSYHVSFCKTSYVLSVANLCNQHSLTGPCLVHTNDVLVQFTKFMLFCADDEIK